MFSGLSTHPLWGAYDSIVEILNKIENKYIELEI